MNKSVSIRFKNGEGEFITGCAEQLGHGCIANLREVEKCPEAILTKRAHESFPVHYIDRKDLVKVYKLEVRKTYSGWKTISCRMGEETQQDEDSGPWLFHSNSDG